MPTSDTQAIRHAADHLFAAIERADQATLRNLFADDIAVWRSGAARDDDKARALRVLVWFIDRTTDRRYEILDRQVFDGASGRGFVQQHILHATHAGHTLALRVCIVIRYNDNLQVSRIDEYFDPADLGPLLAQ